MITRQYGANFSKSSFQFIAYKSCYLAKHVAIKNKIQHLAKIRLFSYVQEDIFINKPDSLLNAIIPDAAVW